MIASMILLATILIITPFVGNHPQKNNLNSDILLSLSSLKVGEIDNSYVTQLISEGKITDLNKSMIEQIGEFYVTNKSIAIELANQMLENLMILLTKLQ